MNKRALLATLSLTAALTAAAAFAPLTREMASQKYQRGGTPNTCSVNV